MKRPRNVDPKDIREPMRRLLEDGFDERTGLVWVCYAEQWPTLWRAQELGYLDTNQKLTPEGQRYLETQ